MMYRRDELRDNTLLHTWRVRSRIAQSKTDQSFLFKRARTGSKKWAIVAI
jgi:hypothetical protein